MSRLDFALEDTERQLEAQDTSKWATFADQLAEECHPDQREFAMCMAVFILAILGRGGGKTVGGCVRFMRRMLTTPKANCFYLGKTRGDAKRLIWNPIKAKFAALGFDERRGDVVYNETELTITLPRNGAVLRLYGADKLPNIQKLRGDTYHEVGIDEAAIHPDAILRTLIDEVFGPRLVGSLWLIGTAGKVLKGLWYELTRRGAELSRSWKERDQHPGWKGWWLFRWTLRSAIEKTRDRPIPALLELYETQQRERDRLGPNHPTVRREQDAEWASDDTMNVYHEYKIHHPETGELWNQWDPPREGPFGIARLPDTFTDWVNVIAIDPGYTDPTAINVFATSPSDPSLTIYHRLCFEKTGMYAQTIAHVLLGPELDVEKPAGVIGAIGSWPNAMVADPTHQMAKALLAELENVYKLTIDPAEKGYAYKVGAIEVVNGDFANGRIKILKDSKLEEQLLGLQWGENKAGVRIENKGQPNHSTDTLVYGRPVLATFMCALPPAKEQPAPLDPRAAGYVPPLPKARRDDEEDYAELLGEDNYAALLG